MDIYQQKSRWKLYLAIAGVLVVLISMFYTNYLASQLAKGEEVKATMIVQALESLAIIEDLDQDVTFQAEILSRNNDVPVIAVDPAGEIQHAKNFGEDKDHDLDFLKKELIKIKTSGAQAIQIPDAYDIYYKPSRLLRWLTYFPLIQVLLLSAFVGIGYLGFNSSRKAEQNRVWVGMAKETAHQLGTPISAILAWIEHLKSRDLNEEERKEVLAELRNDVTRLELIADRFSKIGSDPKLEKHDIFTQLDASRSYMQKRASRKVVFEFPTQNKEAKYVQINEHLFQWVIENLLRNSLDSMEGKGKISAEVYEDNDFVYADISDSGSGIAANKFKTVFQPGFTTKSRGWGLGLSLAKRIIENYHKGKIFVKKSSAEEGTTFTIGLPKIV